MTEGNWIALLALVVSAIALWRGFRTDAKIDAEKAPVVAVTVPGHWQQIVIRLRSQANLGVRAERVRILWPPLVKLALFRSAGAVVPVDGISRYSRDLDPMLWVKRAGTKGFAGKMGENEEHQSTLLFLLPSKMAWAVISSRLWLSLMSSRKTDRASHRFWLVLRISLRDENDKKTTITKRVRMKIPARRKSDDTPVVAVTK